MKIWRRKTSTKEAKWFDISQLFSARISLKFYRFEMFISLFELQDGDTALHIAVLSDNIEIIKVLVEAGADFGIKNDVSSIIWFVDAHKTCF